ncbi:MAG: hypothetical protein ETSY1_45355 [Candidatus Entotheonella factor]|uniref:Sel1 repeat family protein n=1 Tax=Entotheonella factor TaxID=1429438 RepID=W4L313_ENTF1|nr:MAG: hypothetical protein ETSY1_45355 [Candidatus Entotheonella factor]
MHRNLEYRLSLESKKNKLTREAHILIEGGRLEEARDVIQRLPNHKRKAKKLFYQALDLHTGSKGKVDFAESKHLFFESDRLGAPLATMWLARCYYRGLHARMNGCQVDVKRGEEWAMIAIEEVKKLAKKGDSNAAFLLGAAYEDGLAIKKDLKQAFTWYEKGAKKENLMALYALGQMYDSGHVGVKDHRQALKLFRLAAKRGHAGAMLILALKFEKGLGVPRDQKRADYWYNRAEQRGLRGSLR